MLTGDQVENLSAVRSHTDDLIKEAFEAEDPVLVEAPPGSGKTTAALKLAASYDTPVTYLCGRIDLYEEAKKKLEENKNKVNFTEIPSPHRNCPSFKQGFPGNQERLKKLYSKGYSGRKLHYLSKKDALTPCGDRCEYLKKLNKVEKKIDEIDVLIGHHSHSYRNHYINNRVVILDEFNAYAFVSSYPNPNSEIIDDPQKIVPAFLDSLANRSNEFPSENLRDFTDLLVQRHEEDVINRAIEWFTANGASRGDAEGFDFFSPSTFQHDRDHLLAPFLTLSLLCMERVGPEIEMAPHPESDYLEIWKAANLNPSTRVVRNRNTSKMTLLRPPDFSQAKQVVGLDGTPTLTLWNLLLPPNSEFDLQRVTAKSEFTNYLESALDMSLIQIGNGMHHYASGRISTHDFERLRAVKAIEGRKAPLISSKQAIQKYKEEGWLSNFVSKSNKNMSKHQSNFEYRGFKTSNFASVKSSNTFEKEDLGMVFGTPYPGDNVIKMWAGLCGIGVEPRGEGKNKTFVESGHTNTEPDGDKRAEATDNDEPTKGIGNEIYEHYVHNQVVQAVLRFGRDESVHENGGATVYISTHALPSWFEVTNELSVSTDDKELAIVEQLYEAFAADDENVFSYQSAKSLMKRVEMTDRVDSVSERHVYNILKNLVKNNIAECREGYGTGGADQYKWNPETNVESVLESDIVCGTNRVYFLDK